MRAEVGGGLPLSAEKYVRPDTAPVVKVVHATREWNVLFTDHVPEHRLTLFYMETRIDRFYMAADGAKVTRRYLSIQEASDEMVRDAPGELGRKLIQQASSELTRAVSCAKGK